VAEGGVSPSAHPRSGAWFARLVAWLVPPLPADLEEPFAQEVAASNRRRLLAVAPLVLAGHAIHVLVFWVSPEERMSLIPWVVRWRDGIVAVHAVTFVLTLALGIGFLACRARSRALRWLGPAVAALYLVHGAAIAAVDQMSATINGVVPFMAFCLFFAAFATLAPRVAALVYGIGALAFLGALGTMTPTVRIALTPNGASILAVSLFLSWLFYGVRRRDFGQRMTIARQRESLATLNTGLERRVTEQVSEIMKRAEEVEQLNAQLRERVRERSSELSIALAKLAQNRGIDGSLRQGVLLGGRFEIGSILGQGGMGVVYDGVDKTTGARVAIKVIQASSSQQLAAMRRFLIEARACATVSHPAVVRVLHVDVSEDGMLFQVQELVDGRVLHRGAQPLDCGVVARFGAVLCEGLAAAHEQGIVHRDVKPSNILLTKTPPGLKLCDFGIAKLYEDGLTITEDDGTRTGVVVGTPAFMSPEQLEGIRTITPAADVYAVGVILFLLLTGQHPFDEARTLRGFVFSHLCAPPPDVRSLSPGVPDPVAELLSRVLDKDPARRPTAGELGRSLAAIADKHEVAPLEVLTTEGPLEPEQPHEDPTPHSPAAMTF
jgi:serine/threonine-protein kinase